MSGPSYLIARTLPEYGPMGSWSLELRRATADELKVVVHLIEGAAEWLRTKDTDQWSRPWPNRDRRNDRVLAHLRSGKAWIVWDHGTPAATITTDPDDDPYWPEPRRQEPAMYVHRLVVSRAYSGIGLGAQLLDWAGRKAHADHDALWIRVSVWTTNHRLHQYYTRLGFTRCERHIDDGYPSAALFQRPSKEFRADDRLLFREPPRACS